MAGIVAGAIFGALLVGPPLDRTSPESLALFGSAVLMVFALGVVDDLRAVSVPGKFAVQVLAAAILVAAGWSFPALELPFVGLVDLGLLAPVVSILWIVGVTNAINFFDGLDGLASGISAIIAMSFLVLALVQGHSDTVLLSAGIAGACLGFLHHNWAPARVFMGDSGSLTLGFLLAALSVHSSIKASAAIAIVVPLLALGLPAIDALLVMTVRFLESPGHPILRRLGMMFRADRRHLHHVVLHLASKRSRIVLGIYSLAALFCGMALTAALERSSALGLALLLVEVGVVLIVRRTGLRSRARRITLVQRGEVRHWLAVLDVEVEPATAPAAALPERPAA
jgi:UDP-GlcNAc:undecaprenyl-phosphate GlcNAc-1-phosphate transferase